MQQYKIAILVVVTCVASVAATLIIADPGSDATSHSKVDSRAIADRDGDVLATELDPRAIRSNDGEDLETLTSEEVEESRAVEGSRPAGRTLGDRYPELRNRVSVKGLPLDGLDLETAEPELIGKFVMQNNVVAREIERGLLEKIPNLDSAVISKDRARQLYEKNPGTYLARLPTEMRLVPGQDGYVDLTSVLPAALYESRQLSVELSTHPRYETHLVDYVNSPSMRTYPDESGEDRYYPLGVVRWERERFGQYLVGYDAEGKAVSKIVSVWSGVPN